LVAEHGEREPAGAATDSDRGHGCPLAAAAQQREEAPTRVGGLDVVVACIGVGEIFLVLTR
jgi:hypothetical protein